MALLKFPLPYIADVTETTAYATKTVVFSSQKKQVQRQGINPLRTWKISCRGTPAERLAFKTFLDNVGGNSEKFYFIDPDGVTQICRFSGNSTEIKDLREFDITSPTHGVIVGWTAELTIENVL